MDNKNKVFLISGIVVSLILISVVIVIIMQSSPKLVNYSDTPSDWVIDNKNNSKTIDINLVSSGKSFIDSQGQQYRTPKIKTMFSIYGYYQGEFFDKKYMTFMSINNNMNPSDGIIEGYAVFDIVNDSPVFYIFLDEDWKTKVSDTKIYYGFDHSKNKNFEFKEISKGVYMDKIIDDKDSYDEKYQFHTGSILVGDITLEKISKNSNNLTMIVIK